MWKLRYNCSAAMLLKCFDTREREMRSVVLDWQIRCQILKFDQEHRQMLADSTDMLEDILLCF